MPTTTRTIRVFISSTFSDLKAERNALQERVFPRLKRYCQRRGWSFQAIDLRWGISNEAALDQSTMRTCRAEIARCQVVTPRPNFVVLLGDRHGWRPLPDEIPAAEFEALRPHLPADLADRWYRLDENAVCPLPDGTGLDKGRYVLQPRTGEFKDYDRWYGEVEGPLGDAFRRAARELGLPEDARLKYEASATAQEVHDGAFAVPDAREHVVAFVREIRTADGRPLRKALPRDPAVKDFLDLKQGELDRESQDQLLALKQKLHARLGAERITTYPARWEGNGASTDHVHRLSMDVLRSLGRLIHAQIKQHSALPPLEEERLRHQEFAQRRARDFTGQAGPLGEIERYLAPTLEPVTPLVVHGASGSGKSALLAKAVADYQTRYDENGRAGSPLPAAGSHLQDGAHGVTRPTSLVFRFIGATANSTDPRSLLEGLCRELGELYRVDNSDLPLDLNKLTVVFRERLALATAEQPLTLFLDALDQLQVSDQPDLSWLPDKLPAHVRLVISAIPGPVLDALKSHLPSARFLELGPMHADDAEELLQKWLQRAGRRLAREEQRQAIRDVFTRCSLPLYLRLALEEAQLWRSYDTPPPPSPDVDGLIERLFNRLSEPANHGLLLVERAVSYLRCSRYGLSEDETLDLLASDPEYWEHFQQSAHHALPVTDGQQTRRLPVVIWSRLYHDLEPYLSWRSADGTALMVFFHNRFNEVADQHFLHDDTVRRTRHDRLADYFHGQDNFLESIDEQRARARRLPPTPRPANHRKVEELVYQRLNVLRATPTAKPEFERACGHLEDLLTDLCFLEAKTEAGFVFELAHDFSDGVVALPRPRPMHDIMVLLEEALRRDIHFIVAHPTTLFQCLWNSGWWYDCPEAAKYHRTTSGKTKHSEFGLHAIMETWKESKGNLCRHAWLRSIRPPRHNLNLNQRAVLVADCPLSTVGFAPDGRTVAGGPGQSLGSLGNRILHLWHVENGAPQTALNLESDLSAIHFLSDSRRLAFLSDNGVVSVWDFVSNSQVITPFGADQRIDRLVFSPSGDQFLSRTKEGVIRLCNFDDANNLASFQVPNGDRLLWMGFKPDGLPAAILSRESEVYLCDVMRSVKLAVYRGHERTVTAAAMSPKGDMVVSCCDSVLLPDSKYGWLCPQSNPLRIWDTSTARESSVLFGNYDSITNLEFSPDGQSVIAAAFNRILGWNINQPEAPAFSKNITCANWRYSSDASLLALWSGFFDSQIWLVCLPFDGRESQLKGHEDRVCDAAFSPNSRLLATSSHDGTVRLWSVDIGLEPLVQHGHEDDLLCLCFSRNGRFIATGSADHTVRLWSSETGIEIAVLQGHCNKVHSLCFSPDGSILASGSGDPSKAMEKVEELTITDKGESRNVLPDRFAPDDTIRLWSTHTYAQLAVFHDLKAIVAAIGFSADGAQLAAVTENSQMRVWEVNSGDCLKTCPGRAKSKAEYWVYEYATSKTRHVITGLADKGQIDGFSDPECGNDFYAEPQDREMVIKEKASSEIVGWFPLLRRAPGILFSDPKRHAYAHPSKCVWALGTGNYLTIFALEDAEVARPEHALHADNPNATDNTHLTLPTPPEPGPEKLKTYEDHFAEALIVPTFSIVVAVIVSMILIAVDRRSSVGHALEALVWGSSAGLLALCVAGLRYVYPALEKSKERKLAWLISAMIPMTIVVFTGIALVAQWLGIRFLGCGSASWHEVVAKGLITSGASTLWAYVCWLLNLSPPKAIRKRVRVRFGILTLLALAEVILLLPAQVFPAIVTALLAGSGLAVCLLWIFRKEAEVMLNRVLVMVLPKNWTVA